MPSDESLLNAQKLEELLSKGTAIGDFLNEFYRFLPKPAPSILLMRCALLRSFDRNVYEGAVRNGIENAQSWQKFIQSDSVEPAGSNDDVYQLKESARSQCLQEWRNDLPGLKKAASQLLGHLDDGDPLDRFTCLILAKPAEGLSEFHRLYRAADDNFDLASCEALLRIVRNRYDLVDQTLRDALNDREQYYRSRSLYSDDYWRTVAFVERKNLATHFEGWHLDPKRWVLEIHGKGGYGKTMFVRWLIAHRCVVERNGKRIPVARLDSDFIDLPSLSRWPWLSLIPIAHQLNIQLPFSPFNSLLSQARDFGAMLRRPAGRTRDESRTALLRQLQSEAKDLGDTIPKLFASQLGHSEIVIILDTLEELLLHYRAGLREMLNLLENVYGKCPGMQLLLSGRYNLAEKHRLPEFMKQNCPETDRLTISGFSFEESKHYLQTLRGLKEDRLIKAIYDKSKGNPFELSLFADICLADPSFSATQVRKHPGTQYAMLIERIIKRIPKEQHPVAWLLRYAVVPRQLTLEFLENVLAHYLPLRETPIDKPNEAVQKLPTYRNTVVWWKTRPKALKAVWNDLRRYASGNSWIAEEGDLLSLQPEVRVPMRQLLRDQPIYLTLQLASAKYFAKKALHEPERWGEYTAESLYHRFHWDSSAAELQWRKCLTMPQSRNLAARLRIAEIPLADDFVDDKDRPVYYGDKPLIAPEILAQAAAEKAYILLVERLRLRSTHPDSTKLFNDFRDTCRQLSHFEKQSTKRLPAARRELLEGGLLSLSDRSDAAARSLRKALRSEKDNQPRIVLQFLLARSITHTNPDLADEYLVKAANLASRTRNAFLSPTWIHFRRGRRLQDRDELTRSLAAYRKCFQEGIREKPVSVECAEVLERITTLLRRLGRWSDAERFCNSAKVLRYLGKDKHFQWERESVQVRLSLDRHDLKTAIAALPEDHDSNSDLRGRVLVSAMSFEEAERAFNDAHTKYSVDLRGPTHIVVQKVRLFLHGLGNLRLAAETLDSLDTRRLRANLDNYLRCEFLRCEIFSKIGKIDRARTLLAGISETTSDAGLRCRLRVDAHRLAMDTNAKELAPSFLRRLRLFQPVSARYVLLEPFRLFENGPIYTPSLQKIFTQVVPAPSSDNRDFSHQALLWADAARFFNLASEAVAILRKAYEMNWANPHLQRQLRAAIWRADKSALSESGPRLNRYLNNYEKTYAQFPALCATAVLEEAERVLEREPGLAKTMLDQIRDRFSASIPAVSKWQLRFLVADASSSRQISGASQFPDTFYANAYDLATKLGDRVAADNLSALLKKVWPQKPEVELIGRSHELRISFSPDGTSLSFSFRPLLGKEVVRRFDPNETEPVVSQIWKSLHRNYAAEMIENLAQGPSRFVSDLKQLLPPVPRRGVVKRICLRVDRGVLSSIPWEMALGHTPYTLVYRSASDRNDTTDTVRWTQTALSDLGFKVVVDGIFGPQTLDGLQAFGGRTIRHARARLAKAWKPISRKPANVVVIQRSREDERLLKTSHALVSADLQRIYRNARLNVETVGDLQPDRLNKIVRSFNPTLIHIVSSFQESSQGETCVDLGPAEGLYQTAQSTLTPGYLDSILRYGSRLHRLFVFVEAILPHDPYDRARQILLRNAFCSELFGLGNTRAVLATGLFSPSEVQRILYAVARLLRDRSTVGQLQSFLTKEASTYAPPSLFTSDPNLPAVW